MRKIYRDFVYTIDNENLAIQELETNLKAVGLTPLSMEVLNSERTLKNEFGKDVSINEFESESDWFDDYTFTIRAHFETDLPDNKFNELLPI